jgi:TIR domain/Ankyrin repeats (3 copies)/Ankyrin repeat
MDSRRHVFLSYCRENQAQVADLRRALIRHGEQVWWDQDILPGADWKLAIRQALGESYAFVLCLSAECEARSHSGIYPEALDAIGLYRERPPGSIFLIPVRLSACKIPPIEIDSTRTLNRLHFLDLFPATEYQQRIERLVAALRTTADRPAPLLSTPTVAPEPARPSQGRASASLTRADAADHLKQRGIPVTPGAFRSAILRNDAEVAELLISAGIPVDSMCKAPRDYALQTGDTTALLAACMNNSAQVAIALVRRGANVNAKAEDGSSPLIIACHRGYLDLVYALLEKDGDLEEQERFRGGTALMKAAEVGNVEIVQALVERGADVNARDAGGRTALMRAADVYRYHPTDRLAATVRTLLGGGADINAVDHEGLTALAIARHGPAKTDVVDMLIKAGATE